MRKTIENILITLAVVSMVAFIVAGGFMTVYFQSGMIKEYGEEFTKVVKYFFALGWIPAFALSMVLAERKTTREGTDRG
jgi:multidrug efflux pump subunit AcrB